mmetsp:Transcript_61999/g.184684  ORF Transcript_61999/g.184684 Transcript_61999/m.184684 type:complete len:250 (-) Transcript_61999:106-855(-)
MRLRRVHLAEHLRRLLDVRDHQPVLQHARRVDDALADAHLALRDRQRGRDRDVFYLHAQVSDLLGQGRGGLGDVLDGGDALARGLLLELRHKLRHLLLPVLDLLLVGRGDRGAKLRHGQGGLGGADHLLLDLLHGLQRGLHKGLRHVLKLPLRGIDDVPERHCLLRQEAGAAESLERVVHHGAVGAVGLDHVVRALRLHGGHQLQQLGGHAGGAPASGGRHDLVLARHRQLVGREHAQAAQAAGDEGHG